MPLRSALRPLLAAAALASAALAADPPAKLALAGFDFVDLSGEVEDRRAEHAARLALFDATLRAGLAERPTLELAAFDCAAPCSVAAPGPEALAAAARAAGARYLVIGQLRKVSTLIGGVSVVVLDLVGNRAACERRLSYRGDTDEAMRRAATFAARDLAEHCLP